MTKLFIIFLFLTSLFGNEILVCMMESSEHIISVMDTSSEGESEGETQENSKEESKIEIRISDLSFLSQRNQNHAAWSLATIFNKPDRELLTPPPEQLS